MMTVDAHIVPPLVSAAFACAYLAMVALGPAFWKSPGAGWLAAAPLVALIGLLGWAFGGSEPTPISAAIQTGGGLFAALFGFFGAVRASGRSPPVEAYLIIAAVGTAATAVIAASATSMAAPMLASAALGAAFSAYAAGSLFHQGRWATARILAPPFVLIAAMEGVRFLVIAHDSAAPMAGPATMLSAAALCAALAALPPGVIAAHERRARRASDGRAEEAEGAARSKGRFMDAISHELRTPLNGVLGVIELMRVEALGKIPSDYAPLIAEAGKSGARLLELVSSLLDISEMEAGALSLSESGVDLRRAVETAGEEAAEKAAARGVSIEVSVSPFAPRRINGDPRRIATMLSALVDNAVKYARPHGAARLWLGRGARGGAAFIVADDGPGLTPDEVQVALRLFGRVGGVDNPQNGAGVGLTLAAGIAAAHGGRLMVDGRPGRGVIVHVEFPAERTEADRETGGFGLPWEAPAPKRQSLSAP